MINGGQWTEQLNPENRLYQTDETDKLAQDISLSIYENEARETGKRLMEIEIPEGIASCIARGSDRLGIAVPIKFIASDAFSALKLWAQEQNLILSVGLQPHSPDAPGECLLTVFPARS